MMKKKTTKKPKKRKIIGYNLVKCPYCDSDIVYNDSKKKYYCSNYPKCDSYTGVHPGTNIPVGRLSNSNLRGLKCEVHGYFDPLWKDSINRGNKDGRTLGYQWLSKEMNIPVEETHIGWFDEEKCLHAIAVCKPWYIKLKNKKMKEDKITVN